ncbi:MAG TPA: hypothetical protein VE173_16235, partial [Longimicrobiales bacterium]|nr:hypothetical protein [Longimicrobiales bacterium]
MSRAALLCCLLLVGGEAASPSPQTQGEPRPRTIPPLALPALPRPVGPTGVPADSGTALPAFLEVSLSEGVAGEEAVPAGVAVVLSRERVQALLSRLPFEAGPTGTEPSGPGPDEDSGAGAAPAAPADTSLRVVSVLPGGETDLAPWVTVVFSRPMVPLGRDGEPLSGELRVRLDPEPPGGWRWLDVRTLRFEPDGGRLPAATSYSVTVPAGTRSADGAALENAFEATFAVAGPRALGGYPNALAGSDDGLADRDPVVLLTFDQRMDARDVLAGATLVADSVARPLRLVGRTELGDRDPRLAEAARRAGDATWVALRPERPLPPGTDAVLRLAADLPSREGPRPAGLVQELRFRVRGSFEVTGTRCDGAEASCVPDGLWWADLSNPLDPDQPVAERVRVGPEVEGLRAFAMGGRLRLHGDFRPHTTYEVRLLPDLRDRFGQRLGQTVDLRVRFGEPYPYLLVPGGPFVVLDPAAGRNLEVASRGLSEVEVTAYRVEPEDWPRYRADLERRRSGLPPEWVPGGEPPARWTVRPEGGGSGFSRVALDLSRVFPDGGGHALVRLEGRSGGGMPGRRPSDTTMASAWVQATSFAIGGVWDPGELVGWAVSLDDGHPLEGVELRLPGSGLAHPTDVRGLARIGLRDGTDSLLVARWGEEVAILPALTATGYREGWVGGPAFPAPVWFSLTDRGLYRPGEKLEGHGWIRALAGEPRRDLTLPRDVDSVRWEVHTGRDRSVARGVVP